MPGWLKVLLIVAAIILVLVIGAVAAGFYWWSHNKDAIMAGNNQGRDFGRTSDNQGCVDEAISRYRKERGLTAAISNGLFESACLENSRPTPGFCDAVPKETDFMKSGEWRAEQCSKVDLGGDKFCQQLFAPVQKYCEKPARKNSSNSNSN